jgi:phosphatidylserine/phosphatidylglycerophosphate/cardiolipin synthase-like enzyme
VDFRRNPLLLFVIGLILGVVIAELVFYTTKPLVLAEGSLTVTTDRDYMPRVSDLLSRAQDSIHIALFSANYQTAPEYADSSTNRLLRQLVSAHNRGVDVVVVMDAWPEGNSKTLNYLKKNNIEARLMDFDGTLHAKLIIIDGGIVVLGSTNWSYHGIDKNHEANVIIADESIARELEAYFTDILSQAAI